MLHLNFSDLSSKSTLLMTVDFPKNIHPYVLLTYISRMNYPTILMCRENGSVG